MGEMTPEVKGEEKKEMGRARVMAAGLGMVMAVAPPQRHRMKAISLILLVKQIAAIS